MHQYQGNRMFELKIKRIFGLLHSWAMWNIWLKFFPGFFTLIAAASFAIVKAVKAYLNGE